MEPNDATRTMSRAQQLRASLSARRDVEAQLAEASAARQAAAEAADALVEEAQQLAEQLLSDSSLAAQRTTLEARERAEDITRQARAAADAVRSKAEAQVEDYRRRVRAELTEQITLQVREQGRRELLRVREQSHAMIGDLEASVRILGVSLESATSSISEMLAALEELRTHTVESLGELVAPSDDDGSDPFVESAQAVGTPGPAIFDDPGPTTSGPPARSVLHVTPTSVGQAAEVLGGSDPRHSAARAADEVGSKARPMTATEAFLRSSHLGGDELPLPPLNDAEVGARYAREAALAASGAEAQLEDEETLDVFPADERSPERRQTGQAAGADSAGRPLGWLFRSSS